MKHETKCSCSVPQSNKTNWCRLLVPDQVGLWAELRLPSLDGASLPLCSEALQPHIAFIIFILPKLWSKINDDHERINLHL